MERTRGLPFFIHRFFVLPTVRDGKRADSQAGLLTLGSFYSPRLPIPNFSEQWRMAVFVPDHSGGTTLESNEIPF